LRISSSTLHLLKSIQDVGLDEVMGIFRNIKIHEDSIPKSEWVLQEEISPFVHENAKLTMPRQYSVRRIP